VSSFKAGKAACKKALQEELGLPVDENIPLVAFIGRLDYQKGADIVLQVGGQAEVTQQQQQQPRIAQEYSA
jgi:starch synthase